METKERKSFRARLIEVPAELNALIVAGIMGAFMWLEAFFVELAGFDFQGLVVAVGAAIAALATFALKAVLEYFVPENLHGIVNSVLAFLALVLGGVVAQGLLG